MPDKVASQHGFFIPPIESFQDLNNVLTNLFSQVDQRIEETRVLRRPLDSNNNPIVNVGNPGNGGDAVNLRTLQDATAKASTVPGIPALLQVLANHLGSKYTFDFRSNDAGTSFHIATDNGDDGLWISASTNGLKIGFNSYYNGTNWIAKNATAGSLLFDAGGFRVYLDTGLTIGNSFTPTLQGTIDPAGKYQVAGVQVLNSRATGWSLPTGTLSRATFDQSSVTLPQLAQRVAALITDLDTHHGIIGA